MRMTPGSFGLSNIIGRDWSGNEPTLLYTEEACIWFRNGGHLSQAGVLEESDRHQIQEVRGDGMAEASELIVSVSGIRGIVGGSLTLEVAKAFAAALG